MPVVREVIRHILHHVNAEAAESDASQVAGVVGRVQIVRNAVQGLVTDDRDTPLDDLLQSISAAVSAGTEQQSFRSALTNMMGGSRPQLAIQAWVGKKLESHG